MKIPKLSIIVPTLNNESMVKEFFELLSNQNYAKDCVEVLVMDGGSSDGTTEIARRYGAAIYENSEVLAEPGVNRGLEIASGDLLMIMAVDNVFLSNDALTRISRVFNNPEIYAAFPKHDSVREDSIYSKYYNRFTDPFNHFVYGNAANSRTFGRVYKLHGQYDGYDIYDFSSSSNKPMIALAQGFTLRSPYKRAARHSMDDCGPVIDLIDEGKSIAYVYSVSLVHHTVRDFGHFVRKQRWATRNAVTDANFGIGHRKTDLSFAQKVRKSIWPLYATLLVPATLRALVGLIRDRERLWLLHPFLCFVSAWSSVVEVVALRFAPSNSVSRQ